MRHPSMCPIKSPGPTIAKRTPESIGQTTRKSRKSSTKKMRLICLDRIGLRPAAEPQALFRGPKIRSRRRRPSAGHAAYAFSTNLRRQKAYSPRSGLSRRRKHWLSIVDSCLRPRIGATQRKRVFGATHATAHIGLGSAPGRLATP